MPKKRSRAGFSWKQEYGGVPAWGIAAAIGLLAVLVATPAVVNATTPAAAPYVRPSDAFSDPTPTAEATRAAFVGDSFTEGFQVGAAERFPAIVAESFGWQFANFGEGGTGWVNPGPAEATGRTTIPDRIPAVIEYDPDVVVLAAGLNDEARGYTEDQIRAAMTSTLDQLRAGLPGAAVYLVGPFYPTGYPTDEILAINALTASVADEYGVPFIDPIGGGWITGSRDGSEPGNRAEYIGTDGTHPTIAGQAWIAEQMIASLTAAGAVPATS